MLGVRFLMGWSMAADQTRERAEWPPHPDRVFMALAAAHFEGDGPDGDQPEAERAALEWLEGLPAPGIAAGEAFEREVVTSYVPVNDTEIARPKSDAARNKKLGEIAEIDSFAKAKDAGLAVLPEFRVRQARVFPVVVPVSAALRGEAAGTAMLDDGMPRVFLVWEGAEVPAAHLEGLKSLCAKVTSLGHSASLVQMWVDEGEAEADWVPEDEADAGGSWDSAARVRVIGAGRLADLEESFGEAERRQYCAELKRLKAEAAALKGKAKKDVQKTHDELEARGAPGRQRPVPRWTIGYRPRVDSAAGRGHVAHTCFEPSLIAFRRVSGPRLGLESVPALAEAFRGLVQNKCGPAPSWLTGHGEDGSAAQVPHAAVVPMAFVGREHATGDVMGLALVVPRGLTREDRKCLAGLDGRGGTIKHSLTMGTLGAWELALVETDELDERQVNLRAATWTAWPEGATTWATVTPIVFDRHPKQAWIRSDPPRVRAEAQAAYWADVESMIADGCERIGLRRPESVVARAESGLIGVPRSDRFARMRRKDGSSQRHTHAVITFAEPVVGPVLIGAGRYKGYGVCRPVPMDKEGTR